MPVSQKTHPIQDISSNDARGAVTGNGVRYVLGFGLAGAVIALVVVAFAFHIF